MTITIIIRIRFKVPLKQTEGFSGILLCKVYLQNMYIIYIIKREVNSCFLYYTDERTILALISYLRRKINMLNVKKHS